MNSEAMQAEMPFAMVLGEPLTEMPRDLYIPPQAMEVFLDAFEGPLDLLLYLIRRQNLNILDIPIAEITRQYTQYIELMSEMQLDLAGEYLVMAATLAEIKSRMLLPRAAEPGRRARRGSARRAGPPAAGIRALQAAALDLDELPRLERDTWVAGADFSDRRVVRVLPEITLKELLIAFRDVAIASEMFAHHHIQREPLSVRGAHERHPRQRCSRAHSWSSCTCSSAAEGRMGVAVTFIAMLELLREGLVEIVQNEPYAPIQSARRWTQPSRARSRWDGGGHCRRRHRQADARLLEDSADSVPADDDHDHDDEHARRHDQ